MEERVPWHMGPNEQATLASEDMHFPRPPPQKVTESSFYVLDPALCRVASPLPAYSPVDTVVLTGLPPVAGH